MAKVEVPLNLDRGAPGLERPGTYHLIVTVAEEWPQSKKGTPISGWRITCGVLSGTDESQKSKEFDFILWHPKPTDANDGAMAKRKQGRFLLATGLITEDMKGKSLDIDIETLAVNRQFVAKFVPRDDNPDHMDLHFADIWHVDDTYVVDIPKDEANLKVLPQSQRMISGRDNKNPGPPSAETTAKAPPSGSGSNKYTEPLKSGSGKPDYDSL